MAEDEMQRGRQVRLAGFRDATPGTIELVTGAEMVDGKLTAGRGGAIRSRASAARPVGRDPARPTAGLAGV
jgi:hypothetical protein